MKGGIIKIPILFLMFLLLTGCTIGCVENSTLSTEDNTQSTKQPDISGAGGMDLILGQLEKEGHDVSEIRTAIENGDRETARRLIEQYIENAPVIQTESPV